MIIHFYGNNFITLFAILKQEIYDFEENNSKAYYCLFVPNTAKIDYEITRFQPLSSVSSLIIKLPGCNLLFSNDQNTLIDEYIGV